MAFQNPFHAFAGATRTPYCHFCSKALQPIKNDWTTRRFHLSCIDKVYDSNVARRLKKEIKDGKFPVQCSLTMPEDSSSSDSSSMRSISMPSDTSSSIPIVARRRPCRYVGSSSESDDTSSLGLLI